MEKEGKFNLFEGTVVEKENKKFVSSITMISDIIFEIIKKRHELNITQRDLAKKTGIKQPMIARIERLSVMPRLDTLAIIASALDMKLVFEDRVIYEISIEMPYQHEEKDSIDSVMLFDETNNYKYGGVC